MQRPGHPSDEMIGRLISGQLGAEESKLIIAHLLGRCELCVAYARGVLAGQDAGVQAAARHLLPQEPPRAEPGGGAAAGGEHLAVYDQAFALSSGRTVRLAGDRLQARLRATALWAELEARPQRVRLLLVESDPRFHQLALVEHLLQVARDFHWRAPACTLEVSTLAVAVVERLHPAEFTAGLVFDMRAQALGNLANAQRLNDDLQTAERTLAEAWMWLARGTGDPIEHANLLRQEASFRLCLGDFEGARLLLEPAAAIYRQYSDRHQEGRCFLQLALAAGHREPRRGAALARQALAAIDGRRAPRLELLARHTLTWFLNDAGRGREALQLLEESRPLYAQIEGSQPRLHQKWLEGRISRVLGDLAGAEQTFKAVWRDFRDAGFNQDVTLVCLDLAEVYVAQGKIRHAILLLRVFHTTLRLWKMHSHGLTAWLLLQEAVAAEASRTGRLLREAALYFRQSWRRPQPFRHPPPRRP